MAIKYTVLLGGVWMTHEAKRLRYEERCDGCGGELARWVTVVTDRSGSEYASTHPRSSCVEQAVASLEEEER